MSQSARVGCVLASAGALMALCGVWSGCDSSGPPVAFILPNGYTGPVILLLDSKNGADIPKRDGKYRVVIPSDGLLRVRSFRPLERWHEETWTYESGKIIPDKVIAGPAPDTVMLRGQHSAVSGEVRWMEQFVGTEAQYHAYVESPRPTPK